MTRRAYSTDWTSPCTRSQTAFSSSAPADLVHCGIRKPVATGLRTRTRLPRPVSARSGCSAFARFGVCTPVPQRDTEAPEEPTR